MVPAVRPSVAELVFHLFDRSVHPELFDSQATRVVERNGCRVAVRITPSGHAFSWSRGKTNLTEVTTTRDAELPRSGRKLGHQFGGGRSGRCELPGVRYQVSSQVEYLPPQVFGKIHRELLLDGTAKGLLHRFPHELESELELPPIGVVIVEALAYSFSVATFHTFPRELAIVKTLSLLEQIS